MLRARFLIFICTFAAANAQMAESVDALVSNTSGATHPGSSPGLGTRFKKHPLQEHSCKGFSFLRRNKFGYSLNY